MSNVYSEVAVDSPFLHLDATATASYLHTLFVYSPLAIIALDSQHRFVMCNPAFEELFLFSREDLASAELDDLITGPGIAKEAHRMTRLVLLGQKVHLLGKRRRKDGLMLDVEIYGIPLLVGGVLSGVYGIYKDVTARNHAQTAFRRLSDLVEALKEEGRQQRTPLPARVEEPDTAEAALLAKRPVPGVEPSRKETLTMREREVLQLLVKGRTSRSIAGRLLISVRTVEAHRVRIHRKLGVGSVAELVRYALQQEMVVPHTSQS